MNIKRFVYTGLTIVLSACAILVFYDTVFRRGVLLTLLDTLFTALSPVLYGAVMAYLLAPPVNFFERGLARLTRGRCRSGLLRGGAILITWALVFLAIYALFSVLLPQLYQSILTLANNMQNYYNTVYAWITQLLERNPRIADSVTGVVNEYWDELRRWVTDKFLPQAQQTFTLLTSGLVSVLSFVKNFLIGVIVSVYLLALKEQFARSARRLLYGWVSERTYRATLRALRRADVIFSGFVRGKLLDSLIIGLLCFIGASLMFLPYTPLVSVIVGVTNIIPFFGPFLGAIPSAFLILLVSPIKCLYFIIFVLVLQQVDGNYLGPRILGDSTALPSFWVIVAILLGGGFFGAPGMFLGVPVFACLYTAVRHYTRQRLAAKGADSDEFLSAPAQAHPEREP